MNLKCYSSYLVTARKGYMDAGEEREDADLSILLRECHSDFHRSFGSLESMDYFPYLSTIIMSVLCIYPKST